MFRFRAAWLVAFSIAVLSLSAALTGGLRAGPTTFATPGDNLITSLGSAYTAGSGTMTLATGYGAIVSARLSAMGFPTISSTNPLRFTVVAASALNAYGQITNTNLVAVYTATGLSGDVLSGVAVDTGSIDQNFAAGSQWAVFVTARAIWSVDNAVNRLESGATLTNASTLQGFSVASTTPTNGQYLIWNNSANQWQPTSVAGSGSVTSVGLTMPTGFSVSGSPVTTNGTLAVSTTLSGVLKGNGSGIVAATAGTDFVAPNGVGASQTIDGGANANGNLILNSTSNATPGFVLLGTNGDLVGINDSSPNAQLQLNTINASTVGVRIQGSASQTADLTDWTNNAGTVIGSFFTTATTNGFSATSPNGVTTIQMRSISTQPELFTTTNDPLIFGTNNTSRWEIQNTGNLLAFADNTYSIGALGANRPSNVYAAQTVVAGGFAPSLATKTGAYTFTSSDTSILANASTAGFSVTLPASNATTAGRRYRLTKTDSSANVVTLATSNSDTINGASSYALSLQYQYVAVETDGVSSWTIVAAGPNATNVTGTVAIANGGTGQTTASAAFAALSPNTTLGDITYGSGTNTDARLGGNVSTSQAVLTQTGNGTVSAAPSWSTVLNASVIPTTGLNITQHYGTITTDTDAGGNCTFNLATSDWHQVQLTQADTFALSNPTVGQQFTVIVQQPATGGPFTVTWFSGVKWPSGTAPTLSIGNGARDVFTFKCIASGVYLGFVAGQNF
jgi:hypothetical protein